ncbi:hypothetical protein CTEN210_01798 [Chaetoceros tenuissimus]|uniref:Uncharacterized protein n=1 Tax=Chaetoceros tenuissimus TaxID=426638 RepID=A0AAD3CGQ0_9STRA|nr:hypothetical protein CTEN210_01798 [Chaetoceros tenuissimus]
MDNNTELDSIDDRIPRPSWDSLEATRDTDSASTASSSNFNLPDLTPKQLNTMTSEQIQKYYRAQAAINSIRSNASFRRKYLFTQEERQELEMIKIEWMPLPIPKPIYEFLEEFNLLEDPLVRELFKFKEYIVAITENLRNRGTIGCPAILIGDTLEECITTILGIGTYHPATIKAFQDLLTYIRLGQWKNAFKILAVKKINMILLDVFHFVILPKDVDELESLSSHPIVARFRANIELENKFYYDTVIEPVMIPLIKKILRRLAYSNESIDCSQEEKVLVMDFRSRGFSSLFPGGIYILQKYQSLFGFNNDQVVITNHPSSQRKRRNGLSSVNEFLVAATALSKASNIFEGCSNGKMLRDFDKLQNLPKIAGFDGISETAAILLTPPGGKMKSPFRGHKLSFHASAEPKEPKVNYIAPESEGSTQKRFSEFAKLFPGLEVSLIYTSVLKGICYGKQFRGFQFKTPEKDVGLNKEYLQSVTINDLHVEDGTLESIFSRPIDIFGRNDLVCIGTALKIKGLNRATRGELVAILTKWKLAQETVAICDTHNIKGVSMSKKPEKDVGFNKEYLQSVTINDLHVKDGTLMNIFSRPIDIFGRNDLVCIGTTLKIKGLNRATIGELVAILTKWKLAQETVAICDTHNIKGVSMSKKVEMITVLTEWKLAQETITQGFSKEYLQSVTINDLHVEDGTLMNIFSRPIDIFGRNDLVCIGTTLKIKGRLQRSSSKDIIAILTKWKLAQEAVTSCTTINIKGVTNFKQVIITLTEWKLAQELSVVGKNKKSSKYTPTTGSAKSGRWTYEEKQKFLNGVLSHGKGKWSSIAKDIPSRTAQQVKSHAESLFKRFDGKDLKKFVKEELKALMMTSIVDPKDDTELGKKRGISSTAEEQSGSAKKRKKKKKPSSNSEANFSSVTFNDLHIEDGTLKYISSRPIYAFKVDELKAICKALKIKGYSTKKWVELIDILIEWKQRRMD